MNNIFQTFRYWFESRSLREKAFVCILSWSFIYAIFAITLYRPLDRSQHEMAESIKRTNDSIKNWQSQLKFIKEIPNTPLYKEWSVRHKSYVTMKEYYRNLLGDPNSKDWENILKTVLSDYPNIKINSIHHSPESVYKTGNVQSEPDSIYQQQLRLSVIGTFQDIVGYLLYLEKTLPNIHWNTLNYDVKEYPIAEVDMEFSVIYEKPPE